MNGSSALKRLLVTLAALAGVFALGMWAVGTPAGGVSPPALDCLRDFFHRTSWCKDSTQSYIVDAIVRRLNHTDWWPTVAQMLYWVDNLLVDIYTAFFIVAATWAFQERTGYRTVRLRWWRFALGCTVLFAIATAIADHAENFWATAQIYDYGRPGVVPYSEGEVNAIGILSVWKFRLFAACLLLSAVWLFQAFRQRSRSLKKAEAFKQLPTDEARLASFFNGDGPVAAAFWKTFVSRGWHTETPLTLGPNITDGVCHCSIFLFFVRAQVTSGRNRGCRYFAFPAVLRFVEDRFTNGLNHTERDALRNELEAYLKLLATRGFLDPAGSSYEVIEDRLAIW